MSLVDPCEIGRLVGPPVSSSERYDLYASLDNLLRPLFECFEHKGAVTE